MRPTTLILLCSLAALCAMPAALAAPRVKDIAMIAGARENQLVGYGLVVGLANEGDKNPAYTLQSVANFLQRYGITVPAATLSSKNIAAVMVTATIPAFKRPGERIDVTVSSMGDAKTLQGGVLLQTPLLGADGKTYVVAQGPLSIGGFTGGTEGGGGASVTKNHPTVGQCINGGLVEREVSTEIVSDGGLDILLRDSDFTSASRIAEAINKKFPASARAVDGTKVHVSIPEELQEETVRFIARVEEIEVSLDTTARVIINERTGTVVATTRVQISSCAVSHGNLTISIASDLNVSQPAPLSQTGNTAITPSTKTNVEEAKPKLVPLPEMPTVEKVAASLNSLGVSPRDMMSIFLAMKQAGALHAELVLH